MPITMEQHLMDEQVQYYGENPIILSLENCTKCFPVAFSKPHSKNFHLQFDQMK